MLALGYVIDIGFRRDFIKTIQLGYGIKSSG